MWPISFLRRLLKMRRPEPLTVCDYEFEYRARLKELWAPLPTAATSTPQSIEEGSRQRSSEPQGHFSRGRAEPLDWRIAFTAAFQKAISGVDRSMQGRILLALSELSANPSTPRGDTVRPLVGEMQGLWRYRLGDYRLVYEPNHKDRMVVLMDFAPRGGVYEWLHLRRLEST